MATGSVKRIVRDRGFFFIRTDDGAEYFAHRSAVRDNGFDALVDGSRVQFRVGQSPKGPRAEDVVPE